MPKTGEEMRKHCCVCYNELSFWMKVMRSIICGDCYRKYKKKIAERNKP